MNKINPGKWRAVFGSNDAAKVILGDVVFGIAVVIFVGTLLVWWISSVE